MSDRRDPMQVQRQIKQNMEELQGYLAGLNDWTKDMEKKDKEISSKKQTPVRKLPPVRGTDGYGDSQLETKETTSIGTKSSAPKKETIFDEDSGSTEKRSVDKALDLKEKGNEAFKKKDYQKALDFYTQSLKLKEDAVVYCNRATAYYKLNKFQESELDATKCVTLNHTYAKGYARRGIARRDLKNFEGSVSDFEKALTLAPNTKEFEKELEISKKVLEEAKRATSKRMVIEEIEEPKNKFKEEEEIEEFVTPSASRLQEIESVQKKPKQEPKPQQMQPKLQETQVQDQSKRPVISEKITPKTASKAPTQPPKTSYEFEKHIKDLDTHNFYQYLQTIPPENFKKLFKESLTSEILMAIVNSIANEFLREGESAKAFAILKNLTEGPRFEMTVMFLDDKEKRVIKQVFDQLRKTLSGERELESIRNKYL